MTPLGHMKLGDRFKYENQTWLVTNAPCDIKGWTVCVNVDTGIARAFHNLERFEVTHYSPHKYMY